MKGQLAVKIVHHIHTCRKCRMKTIKATRDAIVAVLLLSVCDVMSRNYSENLLHFFCLLWLLVKTVSSKLIRAHICVCVCLLQAADFIFYCYPSICCYPEQNIQYLLIAAIADEDDMPCNF